MDRATDPPTVSHKTSRTLSVIERDLFDDPSPVMLGRFEIVDQLGRGGMGVVYRAVDPRLKREVAVKVHAHRDDPRSRDRLLREAESLASLRHRNVVTVYEVGHTDEGEVFIVMELVEGPTLRKWLGAAPRDRGTIRAIFAACARGLHAAHVSGLVHRDFKPDNVIIDEDGQPRIIDFGLARAPVTGLPNSSDQAPGRAQVTRADVVLGTVPYMAPELWDGEPPSPASDQYALCVALCEALTGERPTPDEPGAALVLPRRPGSVPRRLWRVIERGVSTPPDARWPTLAVLADRLEVPRSRGRIVVAASVVAAVGGVTAGAMAGGRHDAEPPLVVQSAAPPVVPCAGELLRGPWSWAIDEPATLGDDGLRMPLPVGDWRFVRARLQSPPVSFQNVAVEFELSESIHQPSVTHEMIFSLRNVEDEQMAAILLFTDGTFLPVVPNAIRTYDTLDFRRVRRYRIQVEDRQTFADMVTFQYAEEGGEWVTVARLESNVGHGHIVMEIGTHDPVKAADSMTVTAVRCGPLDPPDSIPPERDFVYKPRQHD